MNHLFKLDVSKNAESEENSKMFIQKRKLFSGMTCKTQVPNFLATSFVFPYCYLSALKEKEDLKGQKETANYELVLQN